MEVYDLCPENNSLLNPVVLKYLNRLEDLLFMLARYEDRELDYEALNLGND